jgi:protein N-terminal amidase
MALKYACVVIVGFPEYVDVSKQPASPEYYNSAMVFDRDGKMIANCRKSHLGDTDATWALEGSDGFYYGEIEGLGNVAMGICKSSTSHSSMSISMLAALKIS